MAIRIKVFIEDSFSTSSKSTVFVSCEIGKASSCFSNNELLSFDEAAGAELFVDAAVVFSAATFDNDDDDVVEFELVMLVVALFAARRRALARHLLHKNSPFGIWSISSGGS